MMSGSFLRNATVFGVSPRMASIWAVNVMTMRAWRDKVIYVMGGGQQWRPFIHVEDGRRGPSSGADHQEGIVAARPSIGFRRQSIYGGGTAHGCRLLSPMPKSIASR